MLLRDLHFLRLMLSLQAFLLLLHLGFHLSLKFLDLLNFFHKIGF